MTRIFKKKICVNNNIITCINLIKVLNTDKAPNWNLICSSISIQLTCLFQCNACEPTITYVKVYPYARNWNKIVGWNDMEEHTLFQLRDLSVIQTEHHYLEWTIILNIM